MGDNQNRATDKKKAIDDQFDPKPTPAGKRRKKDTKRWCRGKEGQEHDYQIEQEFASVLFGTIHKLRCLSCQKVIVKFERDLDSSEEA